jgi:thiol-disulfide isomerase/thioredoxin
MPVILFLGVTLLLSIQMASAASLASLLRAAGLSVPPQSTPAADFDLPDVARQRHRLRDQQGKVVFLNFWATWCPPCRDEMPLMEQVYQALRQRSFVMWAVNVQEDREQVEAFMSANRLSFLALLDADSTVTSLYQVRGLPTTYLIDCAGNMVGWGEGPRQWTNDATRTLLDAMLNDARCR